MSSSFWGCLTFSRGASPDSSGAYDFSGGSWSVVATVTDPDGESSGIVDASDWFGPGSWLLDVQGHGEFVKQEQVGDVLLKRESGQLLLMTIPGS